MNLYLHYTCIGITFFIIGIHTQPKNAKKEIEALVDVYDVLKRPEYFNCDFAFIMGDFNYGGSYVKKTDMGKLKIDNPPFVGLIKGKGTSVKPLGNPDGRKPYDRIYCVGSNDVVDVYGIKGDVDTERYGLTEEEVSDIYV